LFRGISSISNDVDEEDEVEFDLVLEEALDYMLTILASVYKELVLPSGASEATSFEKPASS